MIYEVEPEQVSHVSILALRLYGQTLAKDFENLIKQVDGKTTAGSAETYKATNELSRQMLELEKAERSLEKHIEGGEFVEF